MAAVLAVSAMGSAAALADPGDVPDVPTEDFEYTLLSDPLLTVEASADQQGDEYNPVHSYGPVGNWETGSDSAFYCSGGTELRWLICDHAPEYDVDAVVADVDTSEGRVRVATSVRAEVEGQEHVDHAETVQIQCNQSAVDQAVCDAVTIAQEAGVTVPLPTPLLWPIVDEVLPAVDAVLQVLDGVIDVAWPHVYGAMVLISDLLEPLP